jgi:hypothetical protein
VTRQADLVVSRKNEWTGKRPEGPPVSVGGSLAVDAEGVNALAQALAAARAGAGTVE